MTNAPGDNYINRPIIEQIHLSDEPIKYGLHFHDSYQMIFVISGMVRISFSRGRVYEAGADSLIFISNLEEHSTVILEEPYKRYNMILAPPAMDRIIKDSRLLSVFKNRPRPPSFCNVLDVSSISGKVWDIFSSLHLEVQNHDEFTAEMLSCLLYELIISVYRSSYLNFPASPENIPLQIYEIQKYIDNNFAQPISLSDLAKQHYISTSYMSHGFKKLTGYSPKQYLQLNRLSYSRDMLANMDLTISEVAYRSGFSDVNNFIRAFKAYYGATPGSIRK